MFHLYKQFCIIFDRIKTKEYAPTIYYNGNEPREFSSIPLTHFETYSSQVYKSVSLLLETYYAEKNATTRIRQKSVDLRKIVQTALERNRKKHDLQQKQIKDTENRDKYRIYGELLNVYGYNLSPNAKQLDALNYYTNEMMTIPLDDTKTAKENAQKYYENTTNKKEPMRLCQN